MKGTHTARSPIERLNMMIESMRVASSGSAAQNLALAATVAIRDELVALARDRDDLQKQLAQIPQPPTAETTLTPEAPVQPWPPAPHDPWGGRVEVGSPWDAMPFTVVGDEIAQYSGLWWLVSVYDVTSERDSITVARWCQDPPWAEPQWLLPYALGPRDRPSRQPGSRPHGRLMRLGPHQRLWKVLARLPNAFCAVADQCWSEPT